MARTHDGRDGLAGAALKGALAGMIGGMAMAAVTKMEQKALLAQGEEHTLPPEKLVDTLAGREGVSLSGSESMALGMGVHLGYSALWGAIHGVGQEELHLPPALHGLLLGGLVYGITMGPGGIFPRLGIAPPPTQQSLEKTEVALGAHAAFGLATAAAFQVLH